MDLCIYRVIYVWVMYVMVKLFRKDIRWGYWN